MVWGYRVGFRPANDSRAKRTADSVLRFVARQSKTTVLSDPLGRLAPGDPVFFQDDRGRTRQVGAVGAATESPDGWQLQLEWYDAEIHPDECQMFQHHATGRLTEVVATLMPTEKRERIKRRIADAMSQHGERLSQTFVPLVQKTLTQSLPIIEEEFRASVARHRDSIDRAAQSWNVQIVEKRLIPLAKKEILPIVRKHGERPAETIGREIWDRASLWRFGWRALYDKTPLPKRDLVREEWQRFVEQEAVPVLESHMDEVVVAIQRSMQDIAANDAIRDELGEVAEEIAADPQTRQIVQTLLKETIIENDRLKLVWRDVWTSNEAQRAFDVAGESLEPIVRKIGDEIFGSEELGIDPDFARVLRSQILQKDRRWIIAWHTGASNGIIEPARNAEPYPVVYLAEQNEGE